jgi:GT2 family glycosyltransferase
MISIITAVHNQLAMNQLFFEKLKQYTHHPFELIVIDNASTDGSADYFASVGAAVIRNPLNYSYPVSQNQGIALAKYDWLVFINNDIIVSPDWGRILLESMQANHLEVATVCGIEQLENAQVTKKTKRRWQLIKNLVSLFGISYRTLVLMHKLMYGNWERYCARRNQLFKHQIKEGFVGNTVVMHRDAIEKIGLWDERIQGADFDLYMRSKTRALTVGDIRPVHICLDVFVHHYIRLTVKGGYPPFADKDKLIPFQNKWKPQELEVLQELNK